jgi:ubiquitin C-terminal hydrolase
MLKAIHSFFSTIESQKKRVGSIDPMGYIAMVKANNESFNNDHHHDAHEFLIWLLDNLHEHIKSDNLKKSLNKKEDSV